MEAMIVSFAAFGADSRLTHACKYLILSYLTEYVAGGIAVALKEGTARPMWGMVAITGLFEEREQ
jgi:hypothetical protein